MRALDGHPAPSGLCVTSLEAHLHLTSQRLTHMWGLNTGDWIVTEKKSRAWIKQPELESWQTEFLLTEASE